MGWIYFIINKINGKIYVGKTTRLTKRKQEHAKCKTNCHLRHSIQYYGWRNFAFIEWKQIPIEQMGIEEGRWVEFFDCLDPNGYNIEKPTQDGGKIVSEETRKKLSISHKGQVSWNKGRKQSKEWIEKLSQCRKGRKRTEETKKKMSEAHKGKKISESAKQKIGENSRKCLTGRNLPDETKNKISESIRGEKHPFYGKHHSAETKEKISKSKKGSIPWNKGKNLNAKE